MTHGGPREGAGRKPGVPARKTRELVEYVERTGLTPMDYMLTVMRDETAEDSIRLDAAKAAAPYIHSKMPTAIVSPPPAGTDIDEDDDEILKLYASGIHAEADEG